MQDREALEKACIETCLFAFSDVNTNVDGDAFMQFAKTHGQGALNVAVSIALFAIKSQERKRWLGWVGKAAALGAAAAVGAFFG